MIGRLNHQVKPTGHPGRVDAEQGDESGDDDDAAPGSHKVGVLLREDAQQGRGRVAEDVVGH